MANVRVGRLNLTKDKQNYTIELSPEVELFVKGKKVEGSRLFLKAPLKYYGELLEKNKISKEEHDQQVEKYASGGKQDFVRQFINGVVQDDKK